ncbi:hypothetical protein [Actinophytocola sp.]|uniref:hypothetical protein n=1 Tax=Actinophytocola sp. TaxID=1872138 RepID=UPI00389A046A
MRATYRYLEVFSSEVRTAALLESRFAKSVRRRHPRLLESWFAQADRGDAFSRTFLTDRDIDLSLVLLTALFTLDFAVAWLFSPRHPHSLVVALVIVLSGTLLLMTVLGTLACRARAGASWAALAITLLITMSECRWAYGSFDVSGCVLAGVFGLLAFLLAWLSREDGTAGTMVGAIGCAGSGALVSTVFAPFITVRHLVGPRYPLAAVIAAWLTGLVIVLVLGYLLLVVVLPSMRLKSPRFQYAFLSLLLIGVAAVLQVSAPSGADWLRAGNTAGLAGFLAGVGVLFLLMVLGDLLLLAIKKEFADKPDVQIATTMLYGLFDLEFGPLWRVVEAPFAMERRDLRKWLRNRLRCGTPPRHRLGTGLDWATRDHSTLQRLAQRLDLAIELLHTSVAPSLTVFTAPTNASVRTELDRIRAALIRLQRAVLLREGAPEDVVRHLTNDIDAAVTRRWAGFVKDDEPEFTGTRIKTISRAVAKTLVAVAPLAVAVAVQLTLPDLGSFAQGSLYTFAVSWLTASLMRAVDPKVDETMALADKFTQVIRSRS